MSNWCYYFLSLLIIVVFCESLSAQLRGSFARSVVSKLEEDQNDELRNHSYVSIIISLLAYNLWNVRIYNIKFLKYLQNYLTRYVAYARSDTSM